MECALKDTPTAKIVAVWTFGHENLKVVLWSNFYPLIFEVSHTYRIPQKNKNAIYHLQISALVLEIFKFEKCIKYADEISDDVNPILYQVYTVNRGILANLYM